MIRIVPLKFQHAGRHYDFNALALELKKGDKVIVETDRGRAMATVVIPPREVPEDEAPDGLKSILRQATEEDLALASTNSAREKTAYRYGIECIHSRKMEMKLVRAEYAFDGSKIIFYFTADGRIDFRELVKDLAHHFHTRIEMRQIGVRDEAKLVGGLGICGRELCCCSFLTEFNPVSVKMAKEQGLALNPTKISGQCGRLLCCLGYEFETYCEMKKGMPKCGKKVSWQNRDCEVKSLDILRQRVTLREPDGTFCSVTMDELKAGKISEPEPTESREGEQHTKRLSRKQPQGRQNSRPSGKTQSQKKPGQSGRAGQQNKPAQGGKPAKQNKPAQGGKPAQQNKPAQGGKPAQQNKPAQGSRSGQKNRAETEEQKPQQQDKTNATQGESAEGTPRNKRRRRGRRRPRSGPKPEQNNQGE